MKKIKNPFTYSVGHGWAGLSCSFCQYVKATANEETKKLESKKCLFHNIDLSMQINKRGFNQGEYFCSKYTNLKDENHHGAHEIGIEEFNIIKDELEDNILYEACQKEYLCMTPFDEIEKV